MLRSCIALVSLALFGAATAPSEADASVFHTLRNDIDLVVRTDFSFDLGLAQANGGIDVGYLTPGNVNPVFLRGLGLNGFSFHAKIPSTDGFSLFKLTQNDLRGFESSASTKLESWHLTFDPGSMSGFLELQFGSSAFIQLDLHLGRTKTEGLVDDNFFAEAFFGELPQIQSVVFGPGATGIAVPAPPAAALLGVGLLGLALVRGRRHPLA